MTVNCKNRTDKDPSGELSAFPGYSTDFDDCKKLNSRADGDSWGRMLELSRAAVRRAKAARLLGQPKLQLFYWFEPELAKRILNVLQAGRLSEAHKASA